jgi:predicted ATPase
MTTESLAQAGTTVKVRESSNRNMADAQADRYNGPKARIAVARFENKTADSMNWYSPSIGDGMADMLTTALVNSGRYIVLERESLDTVLSEQDLGASGRVREDTAAAIGDRLARLSEGAQVVAVTHAPQVAAHAQAHLRISKEPLAGAQGESVVTRVTPLDETGRHEEVARMLAGAKVTDEARAAAKRLIGSAA